MTAIEFENISKQYRLGLVSTKTLSHDLNRWFQMQVMRREDPYLKIGSVNNRTTKADSDYVWALKDIDFKVEQGEVLGIIGKNGAGKSTLLKLLSRVTAPTTGVIRARGRIASLLEVGTGFHPELTGRENIYMNGSIMGMTRAEITRKLDEIVDFSGCERYIDTPVKRYSSGMTVRLGFAIAAHMDPEILVVDEVLAVGDAEFQKKAIGKMQDVSRGEGRTVLFVSHNMASVKSLCNTGIVLENGQIAYNGLIMDAINYYTNNSNNENRRITDLIRIGDSHIKINNIQINNTTNSVVNIDTNFQNELSIEVTGYLNTPMQFAFEAQIFDKNHFLLASYCPCHINGELISLKAGEFNIRQRISLPTSITMGEYYFEFQLSMPNVMYYTTFDYPILLNVSGIESKIGKSINYQERGFLILN